MIRTCCRCITTNLTDKQGEWRKQSNIGKNFKSQIAKREIKRETYFKEEGKEKFYWKCWNCLEVVLEIKRNKRQRLDEKADIVKDLQQEDNYRRKKERKKIKKDLRGVTIEDLKYLRQTKNIANKVAKIEKRFFPTRSRINIYNFDTPQHWIGWPIFLVLFFFGLRKVYKIKTKKARITGNYLEDIEDTFKEWRLNMYLSTCAYVILFVLIKEGIDKWVKPNIDNWITLQKFLTVGVVSFFIGIGWWLDSYVTSLLKTPLQSLSIKIENSPLDKKLKRRLLSNTQKANEMFKETLKRFGLLTITGILIKLIEELWNKNLASYLCYFIPITYAVLTIKSVNREIRKLKNKK